MSRKLQNEEMPDGLRRAFELELITWQEAEGLSDMYRHMLDHPEDVPSVPDWLKEASLKVYLLELPPPVLLIM